MKKLYFFSQDFGRMGLLESLFVAPEEDVAKAMEKEVYMEDILGKHSELVFTLDDENLKVVSDDQAFISNLQAAIVVAGGHQNALVGHYILDFISEG